MPKKYRAKYDTARITADLALRGWSARDLARAAAVTEKTISLFLAEDTQTPKTAAKIAGALGYTLRRYYLRVEATV